MTNDITTEGVKLTDSQRKAVLHILRNTPIDAVGMSAPANDFNDVLTAMQRMSDTLKKIYGEKDDVEQELRNLNADFAAAGRVLKRMGFGQ